MGIPSRWREVNLLQTIMAVKTTSIAELEQIAQRTGFYLETLAVAVGVSSRQLLRRIRAETGLCTCAWLRELQCREAGKLIKLGYSTKHAAEEAGFASAAHLCHAFKLAYGVCPQAYAPKQTLPLGNNPASREQPRLSGTTPPLGNNPASREQPRLSGTTPPLGNWTRGENVRKSQ
jgi:AraC-like DNA-binding protein